MDGGSWHCTGDRDQDHPQEKEMQKIKTAVWGGLTNSCKKKRNSQIHILIKLTKIKHKAEVLKAAREKQQITHKGIPVRITADLSIETLQARREWKDILKVMKEKTSNPGYYTQQGYPSNMKEKSKDKQKLREFSTTKAALQQLLKEFL